MFTVEEARTQNIAAPITMEELWAALKSVRATTPGPDSISNTYIKKLWGIMGPVILAAWHYSLQIEELCPSHKTSLLQLIPKPGKDTLQLKNWRPITLSNCDHKLITRVYNNRVLRAISSHITATQTAYIKGRNIADNLRTLGAAVRLAEVDSNLDATVIALDAQKASDLVQHSYLQQVLDKVGLGTFNHIFRLLYNDLRNDIIINGRIGPGYAIGNEVKQGDALSCSLFLLAMEPVIRNIEVNDKITAITSQNLNFAWPKILGYADDITVITANTQESVNEVFFEYQRLRQASGLQLNADKTEKFNIKGVLKCVRTKLCDV
jgi:Reverse transcriptase (RNA-dependent DNA polymerase)